jgi:hypothetical protein
MQQFPGFITCRLCTAQHVLGVLTPRVTHRSSSGAQNCNCSLSFYIRLWLPAANSCQQPQTYVKPEAEITVLSSWWWAMCHSKHVEQLRSTGIINCTTRSHLVGYFYTICVTMHGFMNIRRWNCGWRKSNNLNWNVASCR